MPSRTRVLVVDDEPRNIKLLSAHLNAEGYEVLAASNGEEALQMAGSENPDLILLDIMMPEMDGFEATRRLKVDPLTQHIPVVLVTSLDGSESRVKGLDAGADEFLTKPVNRAELLVRVRALLRMKQMQDELLNRREIASRLNNNGRAGSADHATVLVVEDDLRMGKQISDILRSSGYQTVEAISIAAAREVVAHIMPDLILLDRLLPDGDGLVLLDEWKADAQLSNVPLIIITGISDLNRKIEGIEHGADDYLIKPIENNEMLARIRAGLRRSSAQLALRQDIDRLKMDTVTDRLTGVRNRHYLDADLEHRFSQSRRNPQRAFSLAMLDIDHFKQVNDQYGHMIGDTVLRRVAQLLQQTARTADIVTRYGGEEFCVVMPETESAAAQHAAERLRQTVADHKFDGIGDESVTVSLGVATFSSDDKHDVELLARADAALYQAKAGGRNRVCLAAESGQGKVKESTV